MEGYSFKGHMSCVALTALLPGGDPAKHFVDVRSQLGGLSTRMKTTPDIIKEEADTRKAGYPTHDEATTTASFDVPFQ